MRWTVLALALIACRDKEVPPAAPPPGASTMPATVTPAPALPVPEVPGDPNATPAQLFAAEQPDPTWKASTEKTLNDRLAKSGPWNVECRRSKCQLAVTGTRQELSRDIDQLQELRDIAQNVVLTRPDEQPDGKLALRAYLVFARD
jgi:hypothetical protein